MKEFTETWNEGLIVLSLGTTVTPESIPREALAAVGRALRKMPLPLYKVTLVGKYLVGARVRQVVTDVGLVDMVLDYLPPSCLGSRHAATEVAHQLGKVLISMSTETRSATTCLTLYSIQIRQT